MATLEQVFQRERAWIVACDDVDALIEKIGDYREDVRVAERDGHMLMRMRAGDLIELAQSRVVRLKAKAIHEEHAASAPPGRDTGAALARVRSPQRPTPEPPSVVAARPGPEPSAPRPAAAEAARGRMENEKAATRLANAQAAQLEAQAALLKAQAEAAMREHAPTKPSPWAPGPQPGENARMSTTPAAVRAVDTTSRLAPAHPRTAAPGAATRVDRPALDLRRSRPAAPSRPPAAPARSATPTSAKPAQRSVASKPRTAVSVDVSSAFERAIRERVPAPPPAPTTPAATPDLAVTDRVALESVGKWPPLPPSTSPFATPTDDYPSEWTLTGYDLAMFRGRLGITQKVLAGQLGVEQGTISKAEGAPRRKLGPTLQVALRQAIEDYQNDPNRVRHVRPQG